MNRPTPYRIADLLFVVLAVAAITLLLAYAGPALDAADDHSAEWAQSSALADAQTQAARELRRDMAAAALCRETLGEATYQWTAAGQLVCTPRREKAVAAL